MIGLTPSAWFEAAGLTTMCHGQSVYHGFGVVVAIEKLLKTDELHLRNAVMTVLEDPNFQVSMPNITPLNCWSQTGLSSFGRFELKKKRQSIPPFMKMSVTQILFKAAGPRAGTVSLAMPLYV